jgi:hypothetical protein
MTTSASARLVGAVIVLCLGVLWASATRSSILRAAPEPKGPPSVLQDQLPCGLTALRTLSPLVIAERGTIDVEATYRYACPVGDRKVAFFLLVENSRALEHTGYDSRDFLDNLHAGLVDFVDQINYDLGSQGGLILFNRTSTVRVSLSGEGTGKQPLVNAINSIAPGGSPSALGIAEAVDEATRQLESADPTHSAAWFIVIIQAGGDTTDPQATIPASCSAARGKGVTIGLVTLKDVADPFDTCVSPFWTRNAPRNSGEDLAEVMTGLGKAVSQGHNAARVEYCDEVAQEFHLDESSAQPRPPDTSAIGQYCWIDDAPPPDEGYHLRYQLTAGEGTINLIGPASVSAEVRLTMLDGSIVEDRLAAPDVCVYKADQPQFCDPFVETLTPPAPTPPTATQEPPTPTTSVPPTTGVTATDTVEPTGLATTPAPTSTTPEATQAPGGRLFIPLVKRLD